MQKYGHNLWQVGRTAEQSGRAKWPEHFFHHIHGLAMDSLICNKPLSDIKSKWKTLIKRYLEMLWGIERHCSVIDLDLNLVLLSAGTQDGHLCWNQFYQKPLMLDSCNLLAINVFMPCCRQAATALYEDGTNLKSKLNNIEGWALVYEDYTKEILALMPNPHPVYQLGEPPEHDVWSCLPQ